MDLTNPWLLNVEEKFDDDDDFDEDPLPAKLKSFGCRDLSLIT